MLRPQRFVHATTICEIVIRLLSRFVVASHWFIASTSQFGALAVGKTGPSSVFRDPCWPFPRDGTVKVTGRMFQSGQVVMDTSCKSSATAPWTFSLDVLPGTHDLIATGQVGGKPRVGINRGQVVDAATSLPDVDLSLAGTELTPTPIVVVNTDDSSGASSASTQVSLTTANGFADVSSTSGLVPKVYTVTASTVPFSAMDSGDYQTLEVHSPGGDFASADRSARTLFTGAETLFQLIPPPMIDFNVVNGVDVVSWDLPLATRYGYVDFNVESEPTANLSYSAQHVTVTRRWLEDHDAKSIGFDTDVPGYDPSWSIDRTQNYGRWFDVRDDSTSITYMTTENSRVTAPQGVTTTPSQGRYRVRPGRVLAIP
jgi:hypothetical protein